MSNLFRFQSRLLVDLWQDVEELFFLVEHVVMLDWFLVPEEEKKRMNGVFLSLSEVFYACAIDWRSYFSRTWRWNGRTRSDWKTIILKWRTLINFLFSKINSISTNISINSSTSRCCGCTWTTLTFSSTIIIEFVLSNERKKTEIYNSRLRVYKFWWVFRLGGDFRPRLAVRFPSSSIFKQKTIIMEKFSMLYNLRNRVEIKFVE